MPRTPGRMYRFIPQGSLSAFVDCLWTHENYFQPHERERVVPTTTTDLVFVKTSKGTTSGLTGPRSRYIELSTSQPFSAVGVHFKPGGALPFFRVSGKELDDESISLDALWGNFAHALADRLWETDRPTERFTILIDALHDSAAENVARQPAVSYALDVINRTGGSCRVREIASRLGISTRRFLDVFRHEIGLSPKEFCAIQRFRRVLAVIDRAARMDWTDIAVSCGYFDQAHFNHDFAGSRVSAPPHTCGTARRKHTFVSLSSRQNVPRKARRDGDGLPHLAYSSRSRINGSTDNVHCAESPSPGESRDDRSAHFCASTTLRPDC